MSYPARVEGLVNRVIYSTYNLSFTLQSVCSNLLTSLSLFSGRPLECFPRVTIFVLIRWLGMSTRPQLHVNVSLSFIDHFWSLVARPKRWVKDKSRDEAFNHTVQLFLTILFELLNRFGHLTKTIHQSRGLKLASSSTVVHQISRTSFPFRI